MTRVAHVITGLGVGGAETALTRLIGRMDRGRFAHTVITLGRRDDPMAARVVAAGAAVESMRLRPSRPDGLLRLASTLRRLRPDVIQAWMYHANLAALSASLALPGRTPLVWNVRSAVSGLASEKRLTRWIAAMGGPLSRFADVIVYCSRAAAREHERALGFDAGRTWVIPNGFDLEVFRPSLEDRQRIRRDLGLRDGTAAVAVIARWHPVKDHPTFLRAAAQVTAEARFVLAGTGVDANNHTLGELIRSLGLDGRVHLLGERWDIPAILAAMDLFVSPSRSEAFSNTIGEAMATGLPCVVTGVGDSAWIAGETGVVVPPGNPEALAAAMNRLLAADPAARREAGLAARARIAEVFSLDQATSAYAALYESRPAMRSQEEALRVRHCRYR
ncbi:MAG: glycosyltransferase [Bryobacteraceae bacterium]